MTAPAQQEPTQDDVWAINNPEPGSGLPGSPENPWPPPPLAEEDPE